MLDSIALLTSVQVWPTGLDCESDLFDLESKLKSFVVPHEHW
jgi:hypothetical protein